MKDTQMDKSSRFHIFRLNVYVCRAFWESVCLFEQQFVESWICGFISDVLKWEGGERTQNRKKVVRREKVEMREAVKG